MRFLTTILLIFALISNTWANSITRIDHVALAVKDLDQSLAFYTKVLGFKVTMKKTYDQKTHVLAASVGPKKGGTSLELIQNLDGHFTRTLHQGKPPLTPHIGLETVNFEETLKALKEKKVKIIEGPIIIPHDVKMVTIVDPNNYRIDIGQLLK